MGGSLKEHRHGLRLPGRQDGAAQLRQALRQAEEVHRLPGLRQDLRPRRTPVRCRRQSHHRHGQVRGLRPVSGGVCPKDAIQCLYDEAPAILNKKIAEYTKAVVDGRPCFHVSLVVDVSPNCDCHAENDVPIVPDVGMFASFDPVALDQACADAVLAQTPAPNSALFDEGCDCSSGDYFHAAHPDTDWAVCLEHAEKIGIGTRAYELIKI